MSTRALSVTPSSRFVPKDDSSSATGQAEGDYFPLSLPTIGPSTSHAAHSAVKSES
jgi:hypothetical protein